MPYVTVFSYAHGTYIVPSGSESLHVLSVTISILLQYSGKISTNRLLLLNEGQ